MEIYEEKRQIQQQQSSKFSRSPSPEPAGEAPASNESFRSLMRTPPPSRAGPPPSPPVPTHPIAPVPPEPSGPLPLMPCLVCGRTFVPQSLAKHVKICEKMTIKKRKTFDSSRQRREGTDLEQYLPKNFGLPEHSPFLEKSPPTTAKPVPKPKTQSVRSAITKPMAELQKCPHCGRAFGVRAFERHVEWCADKAKILPAAPAQPPPHIADAKQRLNARTQYKAPPVRGRRSSQTRDKSSNSRSGSVDSSRGISPPPPREYGDYNKHPRTRASESVSSNDCHEDSPHVPVIRNSRNSQNNSSGDANVKARQARLARDLSSTRNKQEPQPTPIQTSSTDPNIKKSTNQNKSRSKLNAKKQQQLKKLEEIAEKYKERNYRDKEDKAYKRDKSHIPRPKQVPKSKNQNNLLPIQNIEDDEKGTLVVVEDTVVKDIDIKKVKNNKTTAKSAVNASTKEKKVVDKMKVLEIVKEKKKYHVKIETKNVKLGKESSMSLDSLEDCQSASVGDKNCQSIGINTDFLCPCVPCVIYDNMEQKHVSKKTKPNSKEKKSTKYVDEPQVQLLYKNLTMVVSSCDLQAKVKTEIEADSKDQITDSNISLYLKTSVETENINSDDLGDSIPNINNLNIEVYATENNEYHKNLETSQSSHNCLAEKDAEEEEIHNLSAENLDENYEHDISHESDNFIENNEDDDHAENEENDITCRHGSGDTYTKFTESPADLEEFINITDKMMSSHYAEEKSALEENVEHFHTPKTNSLEAIQDTNSDDKINQSSTSATTKYTFSDSFQELKNDLMHLMENGGENTIKNEDEIILDTNRKISDMEHITVYQLKFYEDRPAEDMSNKNLKNVTSEFKLPSIIKTNKPDRKLACNKTRMQSIYKSNRKFKMLGEQNRTNQEYKTFIVKENEEDKSDEQSIASEAPPLKLPRIEKKRLDDNYDPFASAARQMKELMSSDTNLPKKLQKSTKDPHRTLPILRTGKEKTLPNYLRGDNTKMMKDTLNKTYQKTPTLQRMKSFGSTNNDNNNSTFGSRCSSFRIRNEKKSSQKLNTTFTKSSKENINTPEKNYFTRNSNLNRSFSSYTASSYSTPKPKDKIPKIATSMYHSFQRTTIKQPVKLDKIKREDDKKEFVNLDSILADDNSSMTDSNYIDPRLINENDNLPINVNTILNNPDIISSMESLLTTENLPAKFESFSNQNNNKISNISKTNNHPKNVLKKVETNNNINNKTISNKTTAPILDDLSVQYDKIMSSLEHSIASKTSIRDDESLCEDFDLEEFMTSFDEEINKQKIENKRTCSSTTRIVKQSQLTDSNWNSEFNSICSSPNISHSNGLIPVNKSMSLNFSSNNIVNENLFPSSVKRSASLLDSIQRKNVSKADSAKSRHKADQLEQDIMQSLKDFDKFYESEKSENLQSKEIVNFSMSHNGTAKRDSRVKSERKNKKNDVTNGNYTPNGKSSNDSAYSSLNRISPSKLSICNSKEKENGLNSLEQIPAGSDSSGKEEIRSVSSDEFLAMERSAELDEPLPQPDITYKELENHPITVSEKRTSSRASSRRSPGWQRAGAGAGGVSSSGSEASLPRAASREAGPRLSRFCHECGSKFPVDSAKFCIECGVRRLRV